jgi:hypothetical protein
MAGSGKRASMLTVGAPHDVAGEPGTLGVVLPPNMPFTLSLTGSVGGAAPGQISKVWRCRAKISEPEKGGRGGSMGRKLKGE